MKVIILVTIVMLSLGFNVSAQTSGSLSEKASCKDYQDEELQGMTEEELLTAIIDNNDITIGVLAEINSSRQQVDVEKFTQLNEAYNRCARSIDKILRFKNAKFPPPVKPAPRKY